MSFSAHIFSHPDFNCRFWSHTRSTAFFTRVTDLEPLLITVGRDLHPAPKMKSIFSC